MMHTLDGAMLKIARAQEHLNSFNEEIGRYIRTEPFETAVKRDGDFIKVEGVAKVEPPPQLACIVGDCVTNLRAGLDYVAWELASRFAPRPMNSREERRISFPIISNQADYQKSDAVKNLQNIGGVPLAPMGVIESVQPFNAGYEALNSLDLLVRVDKHRMPLLCVAFIDDMGKVYFYRGEKLCWVVTGLSAGVNLASFGPSYTEPGAINVKVEGKPTALIGFKDPPVPSTVVNWTLAEIIKCVSNIIPLFKQFL